MEDEFLKPENVPWKEVLTDSHEMIRLDEKIKWKQHFLSTTMEKLPEYQITTNLVKQEIVGHYKLLYSMRCFLYFMSSEYLHFNIPKGWTQEIKESFLQLESYEAECEQSVDRFMDGTEFWFYVGTLKDKERSRKFFITMMKTSFQHMHYGFDIKVIEQIVDHFVFRII